MKKIDKELSEKIDNNHFLIESFSNENFNYLRELEDADVIFLLKNYNILINIILLEEDTKHLKNNWIKKALSLLYYSLDEDENICPVCNKLSDKNIKLLVKENIDKIQDYENDLIKNYEIENKNKNLSFYEIINKINSIKNIINEKRISYLNIINYVYLINEFKENELISIKKEYLNLIEQRKEIESNLISFFQRIKSKEEEIKYILTNKFGIRSYNIDFNPLEYKLKIKLDREIKNYSTSEINLMVLLINLYDFIASDRSIIVIDDPLSSYDIPNQYVIMYEIMSKLNNYNKKALIFSHNIDIINISKSQRNGYFEYEQIEIVSSKNLNNQRVINKIKIKNDNNIFSVSNFKHSNEVLNLFFNKLYEKDYKNENNESELFHYHGTVNQDGLSNEILVDLIDEVSKGTLDNNDFYVNGFVKIIYLVALRVWIEKKLYENVCVNEDIKLSFCNKKRLSEKIDYIFPLNGKTLWTGSNKVNREFLMSKKVMLNQNAHSKDQITPFYYALNLTLFDIENEILQIKNAFNN